MTQLLSQANPYAANFSPRQVLAEAPLTMHAMPCHANAINMGRRLHP